MSDLLIVAITANGGEATLTKKAKAWFQQRGLSPSIIEENGLAYSVEISAPNKRPYEGIAFSYKFDGVEVNRKFIIPKEWNDNLDKNRYSQDPGKQKVLYNIDAIEDNDEVFIVEGECDALAFYVAGVTNVVSVPDGAPKTLGDTVPKPEEDTKFSYLINCGAKLKGKTYILAGDMDAPGSVLREELARRLVKGNCRLIQWPDGCKDANDALQKLGVEAFREYVGKSRPYPIRGLSGWKDVLEQPPIETVPIPIPGMEFVRLARGNLMVVTGIPGHGKSTFAKNMAIGLAKKHKWNVTVASFEDKVARELKPELFQMWTGQTYEDLSLPELRHYDDMMAKQVSFIYDEGEVDRPMTVEWIVEMARDAKTRHATDVLIIDPWNELEHSRKSSETGDDYIGKVLRVLRKMATELNMLVVIVAHPIKLLEEDKGGRKRGGALSLKRPTPYHISGSAHWYNRSDIVIVVHKPKHNKYSNTDVDIYVDKVKRSELGERGMAELTFNKKNRRYESRYRDINEDDEDDDDDDE